MACMEHTCVDCDWFEFNNNAHRPASCPECGGAVRHTFDEPNHDEDPWDDDGDDEDDDDEAGDLDDDTDDDRDNEGNDA